jgi:hypothetical protein
MELMTKTDYALLATGIGMFLAREQIGEALLSLWRWL